MKDFDIWNKNKQNIERREVLPIFHTREIWWCALGKNVGYEQDGKNELFERPVIILRKFNKDICIVIPLTSTAKEGDYYHTLENTGSRLILSQIRLVSSKRLLRFMYSISHPEFYSIRKKIKDIL